MSGIYVLVLIALWLFAGRLIYRFWLRRKPQDRNRRTLHLVVGILLFLIWFGGAFWQVTGKKMYWDAKVRRLCAEDGGVTVYETVVLTAKEYDQYAMINWILPEKSELKPSDQYFIIRTVFYYHRNNPQVTRKHSQIVRRSDGKVLGEYVRYGRGGGDLYGPWEGTSFSCYDITKKPSNFTSSIFIREDKNDHDQSSLTQGLNGSQSIINLEWLHKPF